MCRRSSEQVEVERPIVVGGWLPPCLQLSTYSLPRAAADTHNEYNVQVSKYKTGRQTGRPSSTNSYQYTIYNIQIQQYKTDTQTGRQTICQHTMYMRYINIYPKTRCFF